MMKAFVCETYGSPDVLQLKDIPKPVPKDNEMLIKVIANSINAGDWHVLLADPFPVRLVFGLFRPKFKVLGMDASGVVEAVGKSVTQFKVGDEVFCELSRYMLGGYGQYTVAREEDTCLKGSSLTFEQAAALPVAGGTALQAVRDAGKIKPGHQVLIVGASGGVGSFAIQFAKAYGAQVTAVCGTKNMDMVRSLGADRVIDYTEEDFCAQGEKFDVILDIAATKSLFTIRKILTEKGIYVNVGGNTLGHTLLWGPILSLFTSQKFGVFLVTPKPDDLKEMKALVEAGKMVPSIEKVYPFAELPNALRHVETKRARGKNVVKVNDL